MILSICRISNISANGYSVFQHTFTFICLMSIRKEYEQHGAEAYYQQHGAEYRNPHEAAVAAALKAAIAHWQPDMSHVLDLACGSGEVTLVLRELGCDNITGIDPYTGEAYFSRTGLTALEHTFEAIAGGAISDLRFSLIVCSYALHLVPASWLPAVAVALAQAAPALLILTPHNRPEIKSAWGWHLQGELYLERVRARYYTSG